MHGSTSATCLTIALLVVVLVAAIPSCSTRRKPPPATTAPASDRKAEAAALAERGRRFELIGEYDDALTLFDASLRLDPNQPRVHFDTVNVLRRLPVMGKDDRNIREFLDAHGDERLNYYEREIPHLEAFLRGTRIGAIASPRDMRAEVEEANFLGNSGRIATSVFLPDRLRPRARQLERARREMLFEVLEEKKRNGETDFIRRSALVHGLLIGADNDEEDLAVRLRAVRLYGDIARDPYTIESILTIENLAYVRNSAPFLHLLDEAAKVNGEAVATAVTQLRAKAMKQQAAATRPSTRAMARATTRTRRPEAADNLPAAGKVTLTKLDLPATDANGNSVAVPLRFLDYLRCGDGIDLAIALKDLYLMKEKGKLKRIYHSDERFFNFVGVCYDGKYIWAPVKHPEPMVLVIDPVSEQIWTLTANDDKLPPMTGYAVAAPLDIGRVLLSGGFGRAWIADVTFDPARGRANVNVFFTAHEFHENHDNQAWRNLHQAFTPTWAVPLSGRDRDGKPQRRVLVGRSYHPLLVDPEARTVEVLQDSVSSTIGARNFAVCADGLYWAIPVLGGEGHGKLWRFGLPELQRQTLQENLPTRDGTVVFDDPNRPDGRVHLVADRRWYTAPAIGKPFRPLDGTLPGVHYYRTIAHSNHYGLLLLDQTDSGGTYAVELHHDP